MSVDTVYACVYCPLMQKPQLTLESQANCFHPDSNVVGNILKIPQLNYLTQSECSSCHAKIFEPQTLKFKGWVTQYLANRRHTLQTHSFDKQEIPPV